MHFHSPGNENYCVAAIQLAASNSPPDCCIYDLQIPHLYFRQYEDHPIGVVFLLAEMEGFEPPHAFRRLADFESAPFSRLGTSP